MCILETTAPHLDIRDVPKEPFEGVIQHKSFNREIAFSLESDLLIVGSCEVAIGYQKTGYGYKRFLHCPDCGSRRERLYLINAETITCRKCADLKYIRPKLNDESGLQVIDHDMLKIASKLQFKGSLQELIALLLLKPQHALYSLLPKPKHMNRFKYKKLIQELFDLNLGRDEVLFFKNVNWHQKYRKRKQTYKGD